MINSMKMFVLVDDTDNRSTFYSLNVEEHIYNIDLFTLIFSDYTSQRTMCVLISDRL